MSEGRMKRIGIAWYGAGNITSVARAVSVCGAEPVLIKSPEELATLDAIVLPGVGAFGAAADSLRESGLDDAILDFAEKGGPVLGICLGMQLMFETSEESPGAEGLGLFKGGSNKLGAGKLRIGACDIRIAARPGFKVPHTGWNQVDFEDSWPLGGGSSDGRFYFTHSYKVVPADGAIIAGTARLSESGEGAVPMVAAIAAGNVIGVQFHPEKSGRRGIELIGRFVAMAEGTKGRVALG